MINHNNGPMFTNDRDNDEIMTKCAESRHGNCGNANLNGMYYTETKVNLYA